MVFQPVFQQVPNLKDSCKILIASRFTIFVCIKKIYLQYLASEVRINLRFTARLAFLRGSGA